MPMTYHINPICRMVTSQATGRLTDEELRQHQWQLRQDPTFDRTFRQLVDWTAITAMAVTPAGLRQLARYPLFQQGTPRAVAAPTDVLYGLARMFQTLRNRQGDNIAVFRHLRLAQAWLDQGEV